MPDVFSIGESPRILNCNTLFIVRCDKNFPYRHLGWKCKINEIYFLSHPCEPSLLTKTYDGIQLEVHIAYRYEKCKHRWAPNDDKVKLISMEETLILDEEASKILD